jgi:sulfatase maturation enzyme AslB (radical SAM superfamily)
VDVTDSKVFCVLPWSHLCASVDGVWGRCCVDASMYHEEYYGQRDEPEFALKADALGCAPGSRYARANPDRAMTLVEAYNSEGMRRTRLAMLAGEPVSACSYCYEREAGGGESYRQKALRILAEDLDTAEVAAATRADGSVGGFPIYLDLRFGNSCNLKCIMCGYPVSSRWGLDRHPSWAPAHIDPYRDDEALWSALREHASVLRRIYFAGGEPFMQPGHFRLLDLLIAERAAGQIRLTYNSNLTVLPTGLLDKLASFRSVEIGASCDGTHGLFEQIRTGAKWADFVRNLRLVRQHATVWLAVAPQRDNLHHLGDIIDFAEAEGVGIDLTNFVHWPRPLCVQSLPEDDKQRASRYLDQLISARLAAGQQDVAGQLAGLRVFVLAAAAGQPTSANG